MKDVLLVVMGYYASFPMTIPLLRACCSRVTHPSAGRRQKYCYSRDAPRLACVKPAASVHPEPGSNSSLYILYISQLDPRRSLTNFIKKLTLSIFYFVLGTFACTFTVFSKNFPLKNPLVFRTGLQRYSFFLNQQTFFAFFCKNFCQDSVPKCQVAIIHIIAKKAGQRPACTHYVDIITYLQRRWRRGLQRTGRTSPRANRRYPSSLP